MRQQHKTADWCSSQDSLAAGAEEPKSPEVLLMEEGAAKEEPDIDDDADQLLLHEEGESRKSTADCAFNTSE